MDVTTFLVIVAFIIIAIVIYRDKRKKQKAAEQTQLQKQLVSDAENFLASVKRQKFFTTIISSTPLDTILENGEKIILDEKSIRLFEPRAIRRNVGVGFRSRVTKRVSMGTWSSQGESHQEWRKIDTGRIVLTNRRIIFNGAIEHRIIPVDKVISMHPYTDGIEIGSKSRSKSMIFFLENSFMWGTAINILRSIKDMSDLRTLDFGVASGWLNNYHVEEDEK